MRRKHPVGTLAVAPLELEVAVTDQVEVADLRGSGLVQRHRVIDVELDPHPMAAVNQFDVFDLADLHPGGPNELTGPQSADVVELGGVGGSSVEAHLTEDDDDQRGEEQ